MDKHQESGTSLHELKLRKIFSTTKIYSKQIIFQLVYRDLSWKTVNDSLVNARTDGGELVSAMCLYFEMLV